MKLLGFEVHRGHFGCYRPPFNRERWQSRFGFMERAGERWWSFCGAIYMVHAIKRVQGMRLIGPRVEGPRSAVASALQPTVNAIARRASRSRLDPHRRTRDGRMPMSTPDVVIFSDGACKGNPGPGGWGAVLRFETAGTARSTRRNCSAARR